MRRNKTWFFRNNPMLSGLPEHELEWMEQRAEVVNFRRKHAVWSPDDLGDRVFWVRSGIIKVSRVTPEGRELTLQFHTKDDILGEACVLAPGLREITAEAYEDVTVYALGRDDFAALLRRNADLAVRLAKVVSARRLKMERRVGDLLFKTAHARLAGLFLDLVPEFGVRDSRGVIVNLKLTHREMASLIGATRETVSFAILDMRRDGLIQTESKRVIIADEEALAKVARG
jgi:CRP/FNR family transcriptional regulator, cyclic AMP receptor protein